MSQADQAFSHRGMAAYLEIVGHVEALVTLEATIAILKENLNCPLAAAELREAADEIEALPEQEDPEPDPAAPSGVGQGTGKPKTSAKQPASTDT